MHKEIIALIGSIFLPIIYLYIFNIPYKCKKYLNLSLRKPFNCGFCLSFWIGFFYLLPNTNIISTIFICSINPFLYLYVEDFITNKFEL